MSSGDDPSESGQLWHIVGCDCNECEELTAAEKEAKKAKCERAVE